MTGEALWELLKAENLTLFSGVPCSLLEPILEVAFRDPEISYVAAPREDAALGVASGAWLAGRPAGILLQNSGLGNVVNGLTSFNLLYQVPVFMIVSWRGYEGKDAPEHLIMGATMLDFLELMKIPTAVLDPAEAAQQVRSLARAMQRDRTPVALVIKPGVFA
ncbi:MAG: thiamine pyrophosphate-binding protein [Chloroflexota bacterium]